MVVCGFGVGEVFEERGCFVGFVWRGIVVGDKLDRKSVVFFILFFCFCLWCCSVLCWLGEIWAGEFCWICFGRVVDYYYSFFLL